MMKLLHSRATYMMLMIVLIAIALSVVGSYRNAAERKKQEAANIPSNFVQLMQIPSMLAAYKKSGDAALLDKVNQAAKSLFVSVQDGGVQYHSGWGIWFEEKPIPIENPPMNLSNHLNVLLVLQSLYDVSHDPRMLDLFNQGAQTLYNLLPLFDTGYGFRADLNPPKEKLQFRIANPYGYANYPLAVFKIKLRDPNNDMESVIQLGTRDDSGANRIEGSDWGKSEVVDGKLVRRLLPAQNPNTYFYLKLPSEWISNFRSQWYWLEITYFDEAPANLNIQRKSMLPEISFYDLRDGDLHLTGEGVWRTWTVPIRAGDLGSMSGMADPDSIRRAFEKIMIPQERFRVWNRIANGYYRLATSRSEDRITVPLSNKKTDPATIPLKVTTPELQTTLLAASMTERAEAVQSLNAASLNTLRERLYVFDTGYWMYVNQLRPEKLSLKIVAEAGQKLPPMSEVWFQNLQTGLTLQQKVVTSGNQLFLTLPLPDEEDIQFYDVSPHRLTLRYQDTVKGKLAIKVQAINNTTLNFVPLRGGILSTVGDQKWKEASFLVRGQDLETNSDPDLQADLVNKLQRIATQTTDWFFYQYADRHRYFLEQQRQGKPVILEQDATPVISHSDPGDPKKTKPFLSNNDPKNPLSVMHMSVSQKTKNLSDRLVMGVSSDHEKILRFMDYIGQFRVGTPSSSDPDFITAERLGSCGEFTNTLLALAASQGMIGRYINFSNWPKNDGHTVAEIFYEGKWHLYDPTFALYYSYANDPNRLPLSFEQIHDGYLHAPNTIKRVTSIFRPNFEAYSGNEIYLNAKPLGIAGPAYPMVFPLALNMKSRNSLDESEFGPRFQGANYIGAQTPNQQQRWTLTDLEPGKQYTFTLIPKSLGGDASSERKFSLTAKLQGAEAVGALSHEFAFNSSRTKTKPWEISFIAKSSKVIVDLEHPYRGPSRYMRMARYELRRG